MYYLYILINASNKLYVGISNNIDRRLKEHNNKKGAKYTKDNQTFNVCYTESFPTLKEARKREIQLKKWARAKKLALINRDLDSLKKLSKHT